MKHVKKITRISVFILFVFVALVGITAPASAQSSDNDRRSQWRQYWHATDEGGDIDEDEVRKWRTRNSKIRESINELDDDAVEDIYIPILLGIDLGDLVANFGDPRDGGARMHEGLDILAQEGTPIVSPTEAVVVRVSEGSSAGKYVTTANPGDESFVYMHLDAFADDLEEGDELQEGDLIGYVGSTGNASGGASHLHFEIREDRKATDPLPRITREFSLEDKMEFLEDILDNADDEDEISEMLIDTYLATFIQAQSAGIDLPESIEDILPDTPVRDLTVGDTGPDVVQLQSILIAGGYLDISSPTEYFGPLTQSALAAYQKAKGISPTSGYYGPATRAVMTGKTTSSRASTLSSTRRAELLNEIKRLTELVAQLQETLQALRAQ